MITFGESLNCVFVTYIYEENIQIISTSNLRLFVKANRFSNTNVNSKLRYIKQRDTVGSNNRSTLYDNIFYKPEDDPKGSKHVALLIDV